MPHGENLPVLEPLFGAEPYEVVDLDGGPIYLDPRILLSAVRHVVGMRSLTWSCVRAGYLVALLERIAPAIVVTFIDSTAFQMAGQRFRKARFLVVQNGGRLLARDYPVGRTPQIRLREFACLGRYECDEYRQYGAIVDTYYPVGGLIDSYYRAGCAGHAAATRDFDLCLPSQLMPGSEIVHTERLDGFKLLAGHVRRFCETHGTGLCVPLRRPAEIDPDRFEWERRFFESRFGNMARLFPNVPGAYTTYGLCDRSRVSIGMHTTVLREAFGRGNRILSCNFTGNPVYTFPVPGPWTLTDTSYEAFEKRLLWLLNASEEEYANVCGDLPSYLISYDDRVPTHVFLRRLIADAVGGAPEPGAQVPRPS